MSIDFRNTRRNPLLTIVASTLASAVAVCLLGGVSVVFQRDGQPLEALVAAERACAGHRYVSDRDACVRDSIAKPVGPVLVRR